ncbi:insulinase family protein [Cyanobium sp. HWJ4-Hawea]|uniref:M16 family metallopeptidase n=1 Tax=Cyanobium sp. HWJ4-Hawea TaxID=2823713 RepID=UPI0020CB8858|nr:pitrilysin family protein [Cyanobium sp. HWJ4-Hawea]MCP9808870.1 insulinase family protein [Cyanobium sp. HWJ4-Hawea]
MNNWNQEILEGGLPLIWQDRPGPSIVAARLWIRGGSSGDRPGQRGAHQLLAGSMARGCGSLDANALADLVEGYGAGLRSEASEDSLVLSLKCAASDAQTLVGLLLSMVLEPLIEQGQVAIERDLNLQALQRQQEDPFQLAHDQIRSQLFGSGPYGHDPLGIEPELALLGREQLLTMLPSLGEEGALLVLTGSVPSELPQQLNRQLKDRPWHTQMPKASVEKSSFEKEKKGLAGLEQDTEQLVLMLGVATVPLGHPDALALRILQAHLGMGMSSRLFVVMREEHGLAYDVGVHMPARRGSTPFLWHLSTSLERASEACGCLLDEWQRMLNEPLGAAEFKLAKAKYRGQDAMGRQTCGQIADRQALVLGHGLPASFIEENLQRTETLTPEALLDAAQRHLAKPCLSLCGPGEAISQASACWDGRSW